MAYSHGGGEVIFLAGTYDAGGSTGIWQDSNVAFHGEPGATIVQDQTSTLPLIRSRISASTTGNIEKNTSVLTVQNPADFDTGEVVGVQGAGGPSSSQWSTLSLPMTALSPTITLASTSGLPNSTNYLIVDNEMLSYTNKVGNVLTGLTRGLFGTTAASHSSSAVVAQLTRLYARVVSVYGTQVTLDRPAAVAVRNNQALVKVGSRNMSIDGLTLQGNGTTILVLDDLAADGAVSNSTFRNGANAGLRLSKGTRGFIVTGSSFDHNGTSSLSAGLWFFQGATGNTVDSSNFNEGFASVIDDDRTMDSSEWDATSDGNYVTNNVMNVSRLNSESWNSAVIIQSGSNNHVTGNDVGSTNGPRYGVMVTNAIQAPHPPLSKSNVVTNNVLRHNSTGIKVEGDSNDFSSDQVLLVETRPAIRDTGAGNTYVGTVCTDTSGGTISCFAS